MHSDDDKWKFDKNAWEPVDFKKMHELLDCDNDDNDDDGVDIA